VVHVVRKKGMVSVAEEEVRVVDPGIIEQRTLR
jgi:hypothetical protein